MFALRVCYFLFFLFFSYQVFPAAAFHHPSGSCYFTNLARSLKKNAEVPEGMSSEERNTVQPPDLKTENEIREQTDSEGIEVDYYLSEDRR